VIFDRKAIRETRYHAKNSGNIEKIGQPSRFMIISNANEAHVTVQMESTMSIWFSETEFRRSGVLSLGVHMDVDGEASIAEERMTLNVAFMNEIKEDFDFRETLNSVYYRLNCQPGISPHVAAKELADLRDQLETYFAMEEFYGYFQQAATKNPGVNHKAEMLRSDHESLFLQLNQLVDLAEQIVYRECSKQVTIRHLAEELDSFCAALADHEQDEMELMMRLHNEEFGVGD
jgi:hypothetical protein